MYVFASACVYVLSYSIIDLLVFVCPWVLWVCGVLTQFVAFLLFPSNNVFHFDQCMKNRNVQTRFLLRNIFLFLELGFVSAIIAWTNFSSYQSKKKCVGGMIAFVNWQLLKCAINLNRDYVQSMSRDVHLQWVSAISIRMLPFHGPQYDGSFFSPVYDRFLLKG